MSGAVDNHVFANGIVVADNEKRLFAHEIEVLGQRSQYRTLINSVAIAHARAVKNAHEGVDNTVVAYLHIVFNIDEGVNFAVVAYLGTWRHLCS